MSIITSKPTPSRQNRNDASTSRTTIALWWTRAVTAVSLERFLRIDRTVQRDATVGGDDLAGDPVERAQRDDGLRDLGRGTDPTERGTSRDLIAIAGEPIGRGEHRRVGRARRDHVHADARAPSSRAAERTSCASPAFDTA